MEEHIHSFSRSAYARGPIKFILPEGAKKRYRQDLFCKVLIADWQCECGAGTDIPPINPRTGVQFGSANLAALALKDGHCREGKRPWTPSETAVLEAFRATASIKPETRVSGGETQYETYRLPSGVFFVYASHDDAGWICEVGGSN